MVVTSGRSTPIGGPRRDSLSSSPTSATTASSSSNNNSSTNNPTSVKVVLRIRPISSSDQSSSVPQRFQRVVIHSLNQTTLQIDQPPPGASPSPANGAQPKQNFTFDRVIGPEEGQEEVYEQAEALVESFLGGMNSTILAYGQTSSGKSYTMGTDNAPSTSSPSRFGITPRAISSIFSRISELTASSKGATTFQAKLSYVEIYNEDLIDLLAEGERDMRPVVQIREDKGVIIWSGLREVKVKSAEEVMNYLTAGSSVRQTNATDMNAQSSRSHAIFSLTLTQKRYTGTGPPPSLTSSPTSKIRPITSRVTSPTPGSRSGTPTGDRPGSRIGGGFGLRPPSSLGRATTPVQGDEERTGVDSWVTVTSKFHFVDLAGSERLKRTSAQGERVKEGISINSGLLALGNVISALGDPTVSRRTSHIPYRDSKLTRLLQDSLGGNSHTMMVACVSPTEFNLNETVSTVKYANRARNIKNRAEVNEVEVGWDDLEYLQKLVKGLREELKGLKEGGVGGGDGMGRIEEEGGKMEEKYEHLTTTIKALRSEVATLRSTPSNSNGNGASSPSLSRDEFALAVEPIVEEYERSLSSLESQLSLTKAALAHSEEEMRGLEMKIEEDQKSLTASLEVVSELKGRIGKLVEREGTTEAYVRDLEGRLREAGEGEEKEEGKLGELRKELTKNREQAESTEQYIKELEGRLAKSDEFNLGLKRQVEVLERDVERREEAYKELEARLSLLDTSGEHKLLVAEIDERDKKLLQLERTLDELKSQTLTAESEAARFQKIADLEKEAKEELQSRVRTLERASITRNRPLSIIGAGTTPPQTPAVAETDLGDSPLVVGLEKQVSEIQDNHNRTLAELEIMNAKYRESLKEIDDLNSQVQEAKLIPNHHSDSDPVPPSPSYTETTVEEMEVLDEEPPSALGLRRSSSSSFSQHSNGPSTTTTRTSPRSRRSMPLAPQSRLSFLGRRPGESTSTSSTGQSHLRSASLSQELSLASSLHFSSPPSPSRSVSPINYRDSRGPGDIFSTERSSEQMKKEVMKLQQVLTEREEEIAQLEATIHQLRNTPPSSYGTAGNSPDPSESPPRIVTSGLATPPRFGRRESESSSSPENSLSPKTRAVFEALKAELVHSTSHDSIQTTSSSSDNEDASVRLDNLMRAMAKKEASHRETIEDLNDQLNTLRRHHDDLTVLSRDQVVNMSSEISLLRASLESRPEAGHYDQKLKAMQDDLDAKHAELELSREMVDGDLEATKAAIKEEHERAINELSTAHATALLQLKEESAEVLKRHIAEHQEILAKKENEHVEVLEGQSVVHEEEMKRQAEEHQLALQAKSEEMENALKSHAAEQAEALRGFEMERKSTLDRETEFASRQAASSEEHSRAIADLNSQHDNTLTSLAEEHSLQLGDLAQQHASQLDQLRALHSSALDIHSQEHENALRSLKDDHSASLSNLLSSHSEEIKKISDDRDAAVSSHRELLEKHASVNEEYEKTKQALESTKADQEGLLEQFGALHENHDALSASHAKEMASLQKSLQEALAAASQDATALELQEALDALSTLEKALLESQEERERLSSQLQTLRLAGNSPSAQSSLLLKDLEQMRMNIAKLDEDLIRTRAERDALAAEVQRLTQEAGSPSPDAERARSPSSDAGRLTPPNRLGVNGIHLPNGKPPPPTPPPSMPPPPLPAGSSPTSSRTMRSSSGSSVISPSLSTSRNSNMVESVGTSARPTSNGTDSFSLDPRLSKKLEEQDAAIARLTKQLTHCESDLQANIDLVNTLESALNDSERNLRKARQQMGDLARERDTFLTQNDSLRRERQEKDEEVTSLQASIEELEHGLRKEREWKRQEEQKRNLVDGLGAVNESKRSKFNCF